METCLDRLVAQMSTWVDAMGVEHHLVEIGGELRGRGMKPNGQPWWVLVEPQANRATEMAGASKC